MTRESRLPRWLWIVHWVVIVNFAVEILYGSYLVFVVLAPEGVVGPLGAAATTLPPDRMLVRRAYALETWIAIAGLSLYVAITEILPRRLNR